MNAEPKSEYGRFRKEGETLLNLISEELKKHNKEHPDWADIGALLHVRHDLKRLLADMRLKPGSDETEVGKEIEREISIRKESGGESEASESRVKNTSKTGEEK